MSCPPGGRGSRRQFVRGLAATALSAAGLALVGGCAGSLPWSPRPRVHRIGILSSVIVRGGPTPSNIDAFRQGMADLGYVEDQNLLVEYRATEGNAERFPALAAELVELKVEAIVTTSAPAVRAAQEATRTIPIIMAGVSHPVETGLVASLARPGGNVTGLTDVANELSGKRLELLLEIVPQATRVAVLWNTTNPGMALAFQ